MRSAHWPTPGHSTLDGGARFRTTFFSGTMLRLDKTGSTPYKCDDRVLGSGCGKVSPCTSDGQAQTPPLWQGHPRRATVATVTSTFDYLLTLLVLSSRCSIHSHCWSLALPEPSITSRTNRLLFQQPTRQIRATRSTPCQVYYRCI